MNKLAICYFRSLYSQSACSLSVGKLSDYLLNRGYKTKLYFLENNKYNMLIDRYDSLLNNDIIIYKANYKDFEYGIRLFENLLINKNKKFYLIGPFSVINKQSIIEKYPFIDAIIDIQNQSEINEIFNDLNKKIKKNTVISGIDREIEIQEKGHYINVEASTGCIYNCSFCHIKLMNYNKYEKNIVSLVDEIEQLSKKLNKKYFIFNDSVFWKNKNDNERIEEFISLIKKRKIKIYFMIYLSITNKIDNNLLNDLQKVGLIRVFFGVENISADFSIKNNKYVSAIDTKSFINELNKLNISYHIGFILFSRETKFEELKENIDFLFEIKKLFRPGILIEKMRILPKSQDSVYLHNDKSIIDQAYNYQFLDNNVEKYYTLLNELFNNINIRNFEQYFTGITIALTILKNENRIDKYTSLEKEYFNLLCSINKGIYEILTRELLTMNINKKDIEDLKNMFSRAEINYVKFMTFLKKNDLFIFETIPHGTEGLNIW